MKKVGPRFIRWSLFPASRGGDDIRPKAFDQLNREGRLDLAGITVTTLASRVNTVK